LLTKFLCPFSLTKLTCDFGLALHLQHARDCNLCPSPHARLPPAPLVRRCHVQCTRMISRTDTPTEDIDSPAASKRSTWQITGQRHNVPFQF